MKTAIVGYGNIGSVHYEVLDKLGFDVCAVCDTDYKKIENLKINKYTDYIEMLERERPDVVHICTPHHLHADMIINALERDVNVLSEKPLCIRQEDIERILQAEKKSKAKLGVCHQNRYNPENVFIKEYLKDKDVVSGHGQVVWARGKEYYAQDAWRGKWNTEGGGVLINQALHTLDLMIWLLGEPVSVKASLSNFSLKGVIEVEDTASLVCRGDGFDFTFYATNAGGKDYPVTVTVKTKDEKLEILNRKIIIDGKVREFEKDNKVYGKCCYGTGHQALFADFYNCLKTGSPFEINGEEASKVIKVILSAYEKNNKLKEN